MATLVALDAPEGAPTSALGGALRRPFGLASVIIRHVKQETRDAIVLAIAKARSWIDDLTSGRIQSFTQLAHQEGKVERHIRLPLVSQRRWAKRV
jgi:hypothetical protein